MSFGIWELVIILAIVALLFGTKKLRSIGSDMGHAIKSLRTSLKEDDDDEPEEKDKQSSIIDGETKPTPEKDPGAG